jgi:hypothetical protein
MRRPRSARRLILPLLLALVLTSGGWSALAQEPAELDRIADETAELRELPALDDLDLVFLSREEAREAITELLLTEWDEADAAAAVRSAAALGLLPPDTDLRQLNIDLLGEQAGGYYDPELDQMVVIQDAEFGALGTYVFSHETVHALQDAHLGLSDLMDELEAAEVGDDQLLATVALYEGDASLASALYIATKPVLALQLGAQALGGGVGETAVFDAAPPILSLGLVFPYLSGPAFVQALYEDGGWGAVNDAFTDPPTSTEQILHIDKYYDAEEPVALTLPDPAATLGDGWELIDDNTLGEFQTSLLLANLNPGEGINDLMGTFELPEEASAAAAGWDGDRYQFWVNGEAGAFVWQSIWESETDAAEFFTALQAYDEARFSGSFTGSDEDGLMLETDGPVVRLVRDGDTVFYVQAPTLADAEAVIAALSATAQVAAA